MSVRLKVPTQLRELTGGAPELDVEASSIKELLEKVGGDHPDLLERLYRPFWFDRQREYRLGESPIFSAPVFETAGEVQGRFSTHQITGGYALRGEPLDTEAEAAIAAMLDIFEEDGLSVDFDLEPGQIQFVHNRALGHSRTAFVDHPDPGRKRHLVRLWLRDRGRRAYPG